MNFKDPAPHEKSLVNDDTVLSQAQPGGSEDSNPAISGEHSTEPTPPKETLPANTVIAGQYKVVSLLGSGGMSHVYRCHDMILDRFVAVKMLRLDPNTNPQSLQRFQTEGKAVARLEHPNILRMFNLQFDHTGQPLLIMELIEGTSLADVVKDGPLDANRVLSISKQICDGLTEAHAQGIVHRDLKPSNIIVMHAGRANELIKIVDFGIAKVVSEPQIQATQTGEIFGSPAYMSPEQAHGLKIDAKTDQYSLGCVIFEMLTGRPPFIGESNLSVLMQHVQTAPPKLSTLNISDVPPYLERTMQKLLSKSSSDRFDDMQQVKKSLEGAVTLDLDKSAAGRTDIPNLLKRAIVPALFAGILVLVAVLAMIMMQHEINNVRGEPSAEDKELTEQISKDPRTVTLTHVTPGAIRLVAADKVLANLQLSGCANLTDEFLRQMLASKPPLQSVNLDRTAISDKSLRELGSLKTLASISVAQTHIDTNGVKELIDLPQLKNLNVSWTDVDTRLLEVLKKIAVNGKFDSVALAGMPNLIHAQIDSIEALKPLQLRALNLWGDDLTDAEVNQILKLSTLEVLNIQDNHGLGMNELIKLGDKEKLPKLKELIVTGCNVKLLDVLELKSKIANVECKTEDALLRSTRTIDLGNSNATNESLRMLSRLPLVTDLSLFGCDKIDDNGIKLIAHLPLKNLNVDGTAITDASLASFSSMPDLESLSLAGTKVTDLDELSKAGKLKYLNISICDRLGPDAVPALGQIKPLRTLLINGCERDFYDAFLSQPKDHLSQITRLDAAEADFTNQDLEQLAKFKSIAELNISGVKQQFTKEGLQKLCSMPRLDTVIISRGAPASEADLDELQKRSRNKIRFVRK